MAYCFNDDGRTIYNDVDQLAVVVREKFNENQLFHIEEFSNRVNFYNASTGSLKSGAVMRWGTSSDYYLHFINDSYWSDKTIISVEVVKYGWTNLYNVSDYGNFLPSDVAVINVVPQTIYWSAADVTTRFNIYASKPTWVGDVRGPDTDVTIVPDVVRVTYVYNDMIRTN